MKKKRTTARDFGDNPNVRRQHGEANRINPAEPWERRYAKKYKRIIKVPGHRRHKPGISKGPKTVRVKGFTRRWRLPPRKGRR